MKKCLIVLWFGKFPNYFDLYLKSCSYNPTWNYMIYTDQDGSKYDIPHNVEFKNISFKHMIEVIEERLDIHLNRHIQPYKLCDLKPMYGYIFSPELGGYDYWGHHDIDVIWGNLSEFWPDELIGQYDRFLCWGHLTMYKNTVQNNALFKKAQFKNVDWKLITHSRYNWGFDEYRKYALLRIQEKIDGYRIYKKRSSIADISPWNGYNLIDGEEHGKASVMRPIKYVHVQNGRIFLSFVSDDNEVEMAYVHFQKRSFDVINPIDADNYYVLSNSFCTDKEYKGRTILKRDDRALSIKKTQALKLLEILRNKIIPYK